MVRAVQMRKDGLSLAHIAAELDLSVDTVRNRLLKALALDGEALDAARSEELAEIERLEQKANELIDRQYAVVSAGKVATRYAKRPDGSLVIDVITGKPVEIEIEDFGPVREAIVTRLKIMDRKAKMLGLDRPVKAAESDTAPTDPLKDLTPEMVEQVLQRFTLRVSGKTAVDVVSTPVPVTPANEQDAAQ